MHSTFALRRSQLYSGHLAFAPDPQTSHLISPILSTHGQKIRHLEKKYYIEFFENLESLCPKDDPTQNINKNSESK